jgi:DNA invertase Pin-like site-specific DNA recombinase
VAAETLARPRGAAYLRKSPGSSADKTEISTENQLDAITAMMDADGVELVAVFTDVHPRWELDERPDLCGLRQLIKDGGLDFAYSWDTSRLATGIIHQAILIGEGQQHGVEYRFVRQQVDANSPLGRAVWLMTSTFNEMELEAIRDRTNGGKRKRIAAGKLLSHHRANYGYRWPVAADGSPVRDRLEVDPERARVVRRVFAQVASGLTINEVARRLNADGTPPPGRAGAWLPSTLGDWLGNPLYKGEPVVYRTRTTRAGAKRLRTRRDPSEWETLPPDVAPALVAPELWQRAQDALERNRQRSRRSMRADRATEFLLRGGVGVCAACGRMLHAVSVPRTRRKAVSTENPTGAVLARVYRCQSIADASHPGRQAAAGPPCPAPARVRAEALDRAVWERVLEHARAPLPADAGADLAARRTKLEADVVAAERRIREAERRLTNTAAELVACETEEERAAYRGQQRLHVAAKRTAEAERDGAASELARAAVARTAAAELLAAVTDYHLELIALTDGAATPAQYDVMRGLLATYGVRVAVWAHATPYAARRGRGDPGLPGFAVAPWEALPESVSLRNGTSCGAVPKPHTSPDGLRRLLRRLPPRAA